MWLIGVEVEQETSAPPPKKKILDPPLPLHRISIAHIDSAGTLFAVCQLANATKGAKIFVKDSSVYFFVGYIYITMATKSRTYGRGILRFNSWETCRRPGQLHNSHGARKCEESAAGMPRVENGSLNHAQNGGGKSTSLNETTGSSEKNTVGKLDISRKTFFI